MKLNQYLCLPQYLSTIQSFLLAPTRNTQLSIRVAFVSKKGGGHLNSSIQDPREDKELDVPRHKNDGGKLERMLGREMQLVASQRVHNSSPQNFKKQQIPHLFSCTSRSLNLGQSVTFTSELPGLLWHFRATSKGRNFDFLFPFEVRIQKEVILNLPT